MNIFVKKIEKKFIKFFHQNIKLKALPTFSDLKSTSSTALAWSVVEFDSQGNISFNEMPRSTLYTNLKLSGRDIRILISNLNYPTILSRKE
jgi:hypothetical protein